jgi:hypothetical protein
MSLEKLTSLVCGDDQRVDQKRLRQPLLDYLRAGAEGGMNVTDATDLQLKTLTVVA